MFSHCIVVLICVAVSFGSEYQSLYVPVHYPQAVREHYSDGAGYGHLGVHENDHAGQRHLENIHDIHGARGYDHGDRQALRDVANHGYVDQGAHAALHSSGAQGNHARQAHDRGFHEKEKKYAYEKGFGYERETNHRDAADSALNQGSRYNYNDNRAQYNRGGHALRDLGVLGNRYNRGSDVYSNKNVLVDLRGARNRNRDIDSVYDNRQVLRDVQVIPRRESLRPVIIQRYIPEYYDSNSYKYMPGIHGLGGMRNYGQGYGYNPIRYGFSPMFNSFPGEELSYYKSYIN